LLGKVPGLNFEQLTALFGRAIDLIGQPSEWSRDAWLDIGQAALGMIPLSCLVNLVNLVMVISTCS
jgi:hypothetical protein